MPEGTGTADGATEHTSAATTDNASGSTGTNGGTAERRFSQAEVDAAIKDRLERERRKNEDAATKAKADADAKRAEEEGRWKDVAAQHEAKVKELEPVKAQAERYEAALRAQLNTLRKDLPAHITTLLDKLDPAEQLEWIAANSDAIKQQDANPAPARPGTGTRPASAGTPGRDDQRKQAQQELAASGRYVL